MAKTRFVGKLVFTALLVLLTTAVVARRGAGRGGDPGSLPRPALEDGMRVNEAGIRFGPAEAPWAITVFADLTCPFTRRLLVVLDSLARDRPDQVAVVFHHFLIGGRSLEVAVSVECADRFGRAQELVRALGRRVEWNEPLDWELVARNAGLEDRTGSYTRRHRRGRRYSHRVVERKRVFRAYPGRVCEGHIRLRGRGILSEEVSLGPCRGG